MPKGTIDDRDFLETSKTSTSQQKAKEALTEFEEATGTKNYTSEQSALKEIHREYNKLNGFEAMLHIINRYRLVLIPFIGLSIAGSAYSFYNDYKKMFSFMSDEVQVFLAIFMSVMLELVRDGSLIALFNSKMKKASRLLVSTIFIIVTIFMFKSHFKTIHIIEEQSIKYTLAHSNKKKDITDPEYIKVLDKIEFYKESIKEQKALITSELLANTTSMYKAKRQDAIAQKKDIDNKLETLENKKDEWINKKIKFEKDFVSKVKNSQKNISSLLLGFLLLVESLAMLGAVIKFINKDNADKEIAKRSEIIEEYVNISERMREDNNKLVGVLGTMAIDNSMNTQKMMEVYQKDMKYTSQANIKMIENVGAIKQQSQQELTGILEEIKKISAIPANIRKHNDKSEQIGFKTDGIYSDTRGSL